MEILVRRQMSGHDSTQITDPRVILDGILGQKCPNYGSRTRLGDSSYRNQMLPTKITAFEAFDVRFPTSQHLDGSDAMNPSKAAVQCTAAPKKMG